MATKDRKENVSISFHYITRFKKDDNGDASEVPLTQVEFEHLYTELSNLKELDYKNKANAQLQHQLLTQRFVPIIELEKFDDVYISGIHLKPYSGHEIENIDFGKIGKNSINLRRFFFLLYLSKSGRIYLGSQALGNYSGYVAFRDTLNGMFENKKGLAVLSVHSTGYLAKGAVVKEAQLDYSRKSSEAAKNNVLGKKGVLVLKDGDPNFSDEIKASIMPFINKDLKAMRKGISDVVSNNTLFSMNDDDLDECRLVVLNNGYTRTIRLMDKSGWSTQFDTGIETNAVTGHPDYVPLKKAALDILDNEIVSKS